MKKLLLSLLVSCTVLGLSAQLATYDFEPDPGTNAPASVAAMVTASNAEFNTAPGGVTNPSFFTGNPGESYAASTWGTGGINGLKYIEFILEADPGFELDITNVSLDLRRSGSGPDSFAVVMSTEAGFTPNIAYGSSFNTELASVNAFESFSFSSSFTGSQILIRIFGFGATGTGTLRFDNVVFDGTVMPLDLTGPDLTFTAGLATDTPAPDCSLPGGAIDFTDIRPNTNVITCDAAVLSSASPDEACVDMGFLPDGVEISFIPSPGSSNQLVLVGDQLTPPLSGTFVGANFFPDTTTLAFDPGVSSLSFNIVSPLAGAANTIEISFLDADGNLIGIGLIPNHSNEEYVVEVSSMVDIALVKICDNTGSGTELLRNICFGSSCPEITFNNLPETPITVECDDIPEPAEVTATSDQAIIAPFAFISEFHYDNTGSDVGEFIEVVGSAGLDLTGWQIVLYNGSNGTPYDITALSGVIGDEGNGFGALSFAYPPNGIQNGAPDGFALVNAMGEVVEFLSYEGTITADGGPADGEMSTDIGVMEPGEIGESLQRTNGDGIAACQPEDFIWEGPLPESPGALNANFVISEDECEADADVDVVFTEVRTDGACNGEYTLTRTFTVSIPDCEDTSFVQIINVIDTTGPVFVNFPADTTVECSSIPEAAEVTATDNCFPDQVWINEFHYDNVGGDTGEFVELAGTAGVDLDGYQIVLYNGNGGMTYDTDEAMGVIPDEGDGYGAVVITYPSNGLQNGSPDGIALVDPAGTVVLFISYEGDFVATNGPAVGMMAMDVMVEEPGATPIGQSLQLSGSGNQYSDFTWTGPSDESPGTLNAEQTIAGEIVATLTNETTTDDDNDDDNVVFTIEREFTAIDECGNEVMMTQTITVIDTLGPEVTPNDQQVTLNDSGNASVDIEDLADATDACSGVAGLSASRSLEFGCEDIGVQTFEVTATDSAGNETTVMVSVEVLFNEPELGCINEINVTLNEFCQTALIPEMVLAGNTVCLDQFLFDIVVMDEDPSNGPVIDGCGRFQYTIESSTLAAPPPPVNGFVGAFAQSNWNELIINPSPGGDAATIDFTATTLTLNTSSDFNCGAELSAEATYMFSTSGTVSFNFDHQSSEGIAFDMFMVRLDGTMVDITANGTNGTVSELVEPGDMLMLKVLEVDGCFSTFNTLTITDFVFTEPGLEGMVLENFLGCWGFVNAEDKTSPRITDSIVAPEELFCVDLATINLNALPANVSRCFNVDSEGNVPANFYNTALGQRLSRGSATGLIPGFFDGCSSMEICVNDLVPAVDPCDDVVITRVYTATDGDCPSVSGESNAPTVFTYQIIFTRPDVDSVQSSATLAEFSCSDVLTLLPINQFGNQNPVPAVEDYPFVVRADGTPIYLDETFCNLGATFEDGPRIVTCGSPSGGQGATYKFVRTWTVIDWCEVSNIRTFTQLVKVGDFDAPVITPPTQDLNFDGIADAYPLFYSTNTSDCRSIFIIPAGSATDACDNAPTVSAVIYPFGDTLALGFGPYAVGSPTFDGIPRGTHTIRYTATDDCGNESILDVPVTIGDATAPVAICENGLNISIGGPIGPQGGSAQLCADDIDRASYDDCSDVALRISRVDAENRPIDANGNLVIPAQNAYVNCITLTCADLGNVRVSLRVTDDGNDDGLFEFGIDNSNFCWLDVLVEDKTAPICIAPAPQTINCNDLSGEFPDDLNLAVATDPEGTFALLNDQFGAATGLDNCPDPVVTQSVVDNRNSCGVGTIVRTFTVTDGEGFTSPPNCGQLITVQAVHDYTVVFPGDQESDQCIEPDYNAVTYTEFGCDLLTVSTSIDTFSATADECYKLRITYEVLNWCEYNTLDAPYMIPRDADNDGILDMDTTVLHVVPRNAGLGDDLAYLDRDVNRANFNTIANLDNGDPNGILPGSETAGYGNDGSRGAFLYQQFIKVYDDTPPVLTFTEPEPICDNDGDCVETVELGFEITDECSPESVNVTVELDAFINPGADEVYTLADFLADGGDVTANTAMTGAGTFVTTLADLPLGTHALRIRATDGCGNTDIRLLVFTIIDCKAPTPICINGLTATLMPDGQGGGMAAIWAVDFIASPNTDCTGPIKYAIYRDEDASDPTFPGPASSDTGLELDCDDLGPLTVRIYAIDGLGNSDYCLTTLDVQAFAPNVCDPNGGGSLAGGIMTNEGEAVSGVEVTITGGNTDQAMTNNAGQFVFTNIELGDDYTLSPYLDADHMNGVTTQDILLISRHILGMQPLTDNYQLIAADANNSKAITVVDILVIRKLILGLETDFDNNFSWRFVDADYQFPQAGNPWVEIFPEVVNFNNLAGNEFAQFIAVKIGDVNNTANPLMATNFQSPETGGRTQVQLETSVERIVAGEITEIPVYATTELSGLQATIELSAGIELVEVIDGQAKAAENFGYTMINRGLLTFSYAQAQGAIDLDTPLFTLAVRTGSEMQLKDALDINSAFTAAEAYNLNGEALDLGLTVAGATVSTTQSELYQNTPNPVSVFTTIGFDLAQAGNVKLTVSDINGRTLLSRSLDGNQGYNSIRLEANELGTTGVLSYTIVSGGFTATRQMVVVR